MLNYLEIKYIKFDKIKVDLQLVIALQLKYWS